MKISVNAVPMAGLLTGIARYLRNLYSELERIEGVQVSYILGRHAFAAMPALADSGQWQDRTQALRTLPGPLLFAMRTLQWYRYEYRLNQRAGKAGGHVDIHHETGFTPARYDHGPSIFTMCDLTLRRYQDTQPKERVMLFEYFIKKRLPQAGHILTISEFVRREIIEEFHVSPSRVSSVHLAPDPLFAPSDPEDVKTMLAARGLPSEYLLFVSSLEPRKNIDLLIDALAAAKTDIPLVLVGWQGWGEKPWLEKIGDKGLTNRVLFTGHLPDADLKLLYAGAAALVYPSLYEGFGLPILEAMACRCPVICSKAASMPEVAGDAALLIDPTRSEDLAGAIDILADDREMRRTLIKKGVGNAARFTWEKTARGTLDVFKKAVT